MLLARWLTNGGYPTKKSDVENAKRPGSRLVPGIVNKNPQVKRFVAFIKGAFPRFESDRLLADK
jgi:hypothetical protein